MDLKVLRLVPFGRLEPFVQDLCVAGDPVPLAGSAMVGNACS